MMPPAGWYPDPQRPGLQRWWDGAQWTGQPIATPQQPLYGTAASASGTPPTGYQPAYGAPATGFGMPTGYGAAAGPWAAPNPAWGGPTPGGYQYAAPKKRGRRWWTIFTIITLCVLAVIGGGIVLVVRVALNDVIAPRNAASNYLAELQDGDYANAYARLCASDQQSVSATRFARAVNALHPTSYRITGTSFHDSDGYKTAEVRFDETASDGSSSNQTLLLVHETGDWKICHPGQPLSTWLGATQSGTGKPVLPAALRVDVTLLGQSH